MARQLIDSLSGDFDPDKYRDEYRDRVLDLIERKAQGEEIVVEAAPEQPKEVPDLMAALEASIAAAKSPGGRKASEKSSDGAKPKKPASRSKTAGGGKVERRQEVQRLRLAPQDGQEVARPVPARRVEVQVEGRTLSLSNLDKVMYPEVGFTKGQVIDYYTRVAPVLLPHLRGHPLTLKRYPERGGGPVLLREAVPVAPARLGEHRRDPHRPQDDRLLPLRGPAHARVDGEPGRSRAAPVAVARRPRSSARP